MKSLDAISGAQRNHEPACSGRGQTAADADGSPAKAATRFMGSLDAILGPHCGHEPGGHRSCLGEASCEAWAVGALVRLQIGKRRSASLQERRFIGRGATADGPRALPPEKNSADDTGFCQQAVRAWQALVGMVGDKGGVPLVAAWARARINPLDPGAAILPALFARLKAECLTAWWSKRVTMQLELGSTRALACFDRRPRRSEEGVMQSLNSDSSERHFVVGEGANHRTRGRARSPSNCTETNKSEPALIQIPEQSNVSLETVDVSTLHQVAAAHASALPVSCFWGLHSEKLGFTSRYGRTRCAHDELTRAVSGEFKGVGPKQHSRSLPYRSSGKVVPPQLPSRGWFIFRSCRLPATGTCRVSHPRIAFRFAQQSPLTRGQGVKMMSAPMNR